MGLTEKDSQLINKCSMGEVILMIAPRGQEFCNKISRLKIRCGEISAISVNGEPVSTVVTIEEIIKNLSSGEWEIREVQQKGS